MISAGLRQKLYALTLLILIVLICFPLFRNWRQKMLVEEQIAEYRQEISAKEIGNKKLQETIAYLQSDASLEETARLNLGMKKPGENVAVVQQEILATSSSVALSVGVESNYHKWFKYFFH